MSEVVLASCSDGQGILATDLRTGALVATFEDVAAQPAAYGQIGEGTSYVYAVQSAKAIWQAWAWGDKKPTYRASLPEKTTAMAFSPDAALCFAGSVAGTIMVWQMGTGCLLRSWPAHFREVTQLLVSSDGSFLVSASADANVHVYNIADIFVHSSPKPFQSWSGHSLPVTALALLPGRGLQQVVASASLDRSLRLWDLGSGQALSSRSLSSPINSIVAGPTGSDILCACKNGELRILDISASKKDSEAALFLGHTGSVLSCAMSADGSQAVSCSEADKVRLWDVRTHQCISQAHTSRNVRINSVQIMRRWVSPQPLAAFKPFQRLLTKPEEVKPIPLGVTGRELALQEALTQECAGAPGGDAAGAAGEGDLGDGEGETLQQRLARVEEERARWAKVAADLYGMIVQGGMDLSAAQKLAVGEEPQAAASVAANSTDGVVGASASSEVRKLAEDSDDEDESPERKRPRADDGAGASSPQASAKAKPKAAIAKQKPRKEAAAAAAGTSAAGTSVAASAAAAAAAAAAAVPTPTPAPAASAAARVAAAGSSDGEEEAAEPSPSKPKQKSKLAASKQASSKEEKKKGKKKKLGKA